jgi:hypothetical protein
MISVITKANLRQDRNIDFSCQSGSLVTGKANNMDDFLSEKANLYMFDSCAESMSKIASIMMQIKE